MSGLTDWFDVFKCGTRKDHSGRICSIGRSDVDEAIRKYDPSNPVPLVIGHPTLNAPAWGWTQAFRRIGDLVQAKASSVVADFEDLVKKGMYKNRSISFNPDGTFNHIGFLGAAAPAVKGLRDISFCNNMEDIITMDFSEEELKTANTSEEKPVLIAEPVSVRQEPEKIASVSMEDKTETEELKNKIAEMEKQLAETKAAAEVHRVAFETEQKKNRAANFAAYTDSLVKAGKLVADKKNDVCNMMEVLHGVGSREFAGETKSALSVFQEILDRQPASVSFSEFATADCVAGGMSVQQIADKAIEYQQAQEKLGKAVSVSSAVNYVMGGF